MAVYDSTALLRGVRRLGFLPDASDLTDTDLLEFADEEQVTLISSAVKTEREEHYVTFVDYLLSSTRTYAIPTRAMGRMVRGITLITPAGVTVPCPAIDPVHGWDGRASVSNTSYCHYIAGDSIVFPALPPPGWTMRVWYLRRPSSLCLVADAALVTSVPTTLSLGVSATTTWIDLNVSTYMDMVRGQAPFDAIYDDLVMASVAGTTITLNASTPVDTATIAAGAPVGSAPIYVCQRGQTIYPQIPAEFFPALEAGVCRRALEAIGDRDGAQLVTATRAERLTSAVDITSPRDETGGRAIVRRNSPLRSGGGWGGGRGGFGRRFR